VTGIDAIVEGDTPVGGLSSSAAVGVAYLLALEAANDLVVSPDDNVELDRYIENVYLGVHNGILDQSVILKSQPDHLSYLDCQTLAFERVPTPVSREAYEILIAYSGLARPLMSTDYNKRVGECQDAAAMLLSAAGRPVPDQPLLRMVSQNEYESLSPQLPPALGRRARHFFEEIRRVREGVSAWRSGDLGRVGRLMTASGDSSVHYYESGCPHLITLHNILRECNGVYGARFAGGGFRGCCVGLSDPRFRDEIEATVRSGYLAAHPDTRHSFQMLFCQSGGPARLLDGR
jgi:galactokinase/galacturonokinase